MKISNKGIISIALLAMLIFPIISMQIPSINAQSGTTSYPFLGAVPNPVGVGQEVLLHAGALTALQTAADGWVGLTITVVKPDNTTETLNVPKTDSTGGTGLIYIPNQVGTYLMTMNFPAQWYNYTTAQGARINTYYLEAQSETLELVVQQEPVQYYPAAPLPTEYWTRPIDAQLREWYSIAGSWVATPSNLFAPYNDAPDAPHVLWTMPIGESMGGLAGGEFNGDSYGNGDAYEGKWSGSIIISGVLFFHQDESGSPNQDVTAVDLHTGKVLWSKPLFENSRFNFGQILNHKSRNYHGVFSYLWVQSSAGGKTIWSAFDPLTADWRFNITDIPSGTNYYGPNGEILKYSISGGRLLKWNQTYIVHQGKTGMSESWGSQVKGQIYNATTRPGYDLNVSAAGGATLPGSILMVYPGDRIIGGSVNQSMVRLWGLDLRTGSEGNLLFSKDWNAPTEWVQGNITVSGFQAGWAAFSQESKVGVLFTKELRQYYGFSLETGDFMWTTEPQHYLDAWDDSLTLSFGPNTAIAYGKLFTGSISGIANAYDIKTGKRVWQYTAEDIYSEFQFTNNWWLRLMFISDGKVYYGHLEHSANNPRPRGAPFFALDAETGELVFRADGLFRQSRWGGRAILGDSIIATQDTYSQQVYAIGKGPSKITVTAPNFGVPQGSSVVISGLISDVSPGTEDYSLRARFPNGVPAVSDESMGSWMGYVYKQFARPSNATGVEVTLSVVDANGNFRDIGKVTSNADGFYTLDWKPDIEGPYTVYASFAGTESYYPSHAVASFSVDAAAPTTQPTPTVQPSTVEQYFVPAVAGIIIAIILGFAVTIVVLKKRP